MADDDDGKYSVVASELYKLNVERLKVGMQIQADYGKWLIATLSVLHSAGAYAVATALYKTLPHSAIVPFVVGILLTLLSGLFTWTNFTLYVVDMEAGCDPHMIYYRERWPKQDSKLAWWANFAMGGALVSGIGAALCIPWEAYVVL